MYTRLHFALLSWDNSRGKRTIQDENVELRMRMYDVDLVSGIAYIVLSV